VVVGARRAEIGEALVGRPRSGGGKAVFVPADVSVEADAEALVAAAMAEFGRWAYLRHVNGDNANIRRDAKNPFTLASGRPSGPIRNG
jgi:NAD(P)-dependent dehydrogenase (short-subunit alcohol dehydrogenase family)